jgi:thiosulfate dehydrogenase
MRPPTTLHLIVVFAAVGLCVLFAKHPEQQPSPPEAASLTVYPSVAPAAHRLPTPTIATKLRLPAAARVARLAPWQIPDPESLSDDIFGRSVRYGRDLIAHTSALIGADAKDPWMRYSGNGLECQSCHLDAGTRRFGLPLAGAWAVFPTFIGREDEVRTLEERINGCMERSMNGRALPESGPEMKAMLTYIRYISDGVRIGTPPVGRGVPALQLPGKASDPRRGAEVFQTRCAICHQPNGQGKRLAAADATRERRRYAFPPLWGPESYNDGAGMARSITAASFIRASMPLGTDFEHPVLAPEEAFDVAVYINGQPRPHKAGILNDYPDRWLKPADAAYPPFADPFSIEQHRVGPWSPIQRWLKQNAGLHGAASDTLLANPEVGEHAPPAAAEPQIIRQSVLR